MGLIPFYSESNPFMQSVITTKLNTVKAFCQECSIKELEQYISIIQRMEIQHFDAWDGFEKFFEPEQLDVVLSIKARIQEEENPLVASHLQCRMPHDLLKGERIATAINQILPSEGVSECMDRSSLHTSAVVVLHNGEPQSILCQEAAELITEQVVGRFALSDCHVIPQNGHHRRAEGNDLNLAILRMPENNLSTAQVYILILNVSYCGSPTTAVQKEVHDDPIPILAELAIGFRLSQERQKFFVGVGFLHCFGCLVGFKISFCVALFVAPRKEAFQRASVAVDGTVGQTFLSHLKNHVVEDCRSEPIDGHGHIQSFRNCVKMLFVSCYGFVFNSSGCDC